jgi:hypothetical protein
MVAAMDPNKALIYVIFGGTKNVFGKPLTNGFYNTFCIYNIMSKIWFYQGFLEPS